MARPRKDKSQRELLDVLTTPEDPAESREDPWSQMPGEAIHRYKWFLKYRDMGPSRSVQKLATEYRLSRSTMHHMCRNFRWVERANAWDDWLDRQFVANLTAQRREAVEKHMEVSQTFMDRVCERLLQLDANALTPTHLSMWFDLAVKVQRVSLGLETLAKDGSIVVNQTLNQNTTHNTAIVAGNEMEEKILEYADVFRKMEETQRPEVRKENNGRGNSGLLLRPGDQK